jgi:hypothetical protein
MYSKKLSSNLITSPVRLHIGDSVQPSEQPSGEAKQIWTSRLEVCYLKAYFHETGQDGSDRLVMGHVEPV